MHSWVFQRRSNVGETRAINLGTRAILNVFEKLARACFFPKFHSKQKPEPKCKKTTIFFQINIEKAVHIFCFSMSIFQHIFKGQFEHDFGIQLLNVVFIRTKCFHQVKNIFQARFCRQKYYRNSLPWSLDILYIFLYCWNRVGKCRLNTF